MSVIPMVRNRPSRFVTPISMERPTMISAMKMEIFFHPRMQQRKFPVRLQISRNLISITRLTQRQMQTGRSLSGLSPAMASY